MKIIQVISALIVFYVFRQNAFMLVLYTVFIFYFVLKNMFQPFEQSFISKTAERKNYGTVMGIRQSFFMLGNVIGPIISGFIYDFDPLLMFDISAIMFLGAFILMNVSQHMSKKEPDGRAFKIEPKTI
jgi:DHA1 family multidrug resistance protein-like MFS transporter